MKSIILTIIFLLIFQNLAFSKDSNEISKDLNKIVENVINLEGDKRASICVVYGDKYFLKDFGKSSENFSEKYNIGGLSRIFIGVIAVEFNETGRINFNDSISKYLSELRNKYQSNIRISDLLEDHTYLPYSYPYKIDSAEDFWNFLIKNENILKYNESYNRSQISNDILLLIIEKIEKNSFKNSFVDLFKKFNLNNTDFYNNQKSEQFPLSNRFYSSPENMSKFLSAIMSNKKISEKIFERFARTSYDQDLYFTPSFISQDITLIDENNVYNKYNLYYQYDDSTSSFVFVIPQKKFAIVFLSNFPISFDKKDYLSKELLKVSLKDFLNMDIFDYRANLSLKKVEDKSDLLDFYKGFFENRKGITEFHVVDKDLMCNMNKKFYFVRFYIDSSFSLIPVEDNNDYIKELRFRFTYINGIRYLDLLNFGQNILFAREIEEPRYSDIWKERSGKWISVSKNSLIKDVEIERFRGFYMLDYTDSVGERMSLVLVPVSDNSAKLIDFSDLVINFDSNDQNMSFNFLGDKFIKGN
ncbi:beta-lactamase [Thermodesulfobium narugense DSM 14796]|uniref:Beta-lactamase n=1 Tax=Thermodesulfobium narugense DSM 14796 TaxID=747365 RepID=M1E8G1_9BACT|nr:serine hydrolase domain-containing protein [Thermodesulfobium narugense]AEE15153.1 beta-lactamase [Thermodesulfobium narugense DSM 14796]